MSSLRGMPHAQRFFLLIIAQGMLFFLVKPFALGLGFALFEAMQLFTVFWFKRPKMTPTLVIQTSLALVLSQLVWLRADNLVQTLAIFLTLSLNWSIFFSLWQRREPTLIDALSFPVLWKNQFLYYTRLATKSLRSVIPKVQFRFGLPSLPWVFLRKVFSGLAVGLPAVFILLILFAVADQNFSSALEKVFTHWQTVFENFFTLQWLLPFLNWVKRTVPDLALFWLYITALYPTHQDIQITAKKVSRALFIEKVTSSVVITLPFLAFIVLQFNLWPTMVESFRTGALNPALTIRESFSQLFLACGIGMGMVFFLLKEKTVTKWRYAIVLMISFILLAEVFLVSLNAGFRLWVYQFLHGFTVYRLWGVLLLLWLWSALAWLVRPLFPKQNREMVPELFAFGLMSFSCVVALAGLLNIHQLVMRKMPVVNKEVDWNYIQYTISTDARYFFLSESRKFSQLDEVCSNDQTELSLECVQLVEDLQPAYEKLEHFDAYLQQRLIETYRPNNQISLATMCDEVLGEIEKKPFLQKHGSDWHVPALCKVWSEDWNKGRNVYERLFEQASPSAPTTMRVLNLVYTDSSNIHGSYVTSRIAGLVNEIEYVAQTDSESLVQYRTVDTRFFNTSQLPVSEQFYQNGPSRNYVNAKKMLSEQDVCALVDTDQVDEVWVWFMQSEHSKGTQALMYPNFGVIRSQERVWQNYLSLSDEDFEKTVPELCGKTVAFAMFDLNESTDRYMQTLGNRLVALAEYKNRPALMSFTESANDFNLMRQHDGRLVVACGRPQVAPNIPAGGSGSVTYLTYDNKNKVLSDCDDWNPQRNGVVTEISCENWNCTRSGYVLWWMERFQEQMRVNDTDSAKPWPNLWREVSRDL